MTRLLNAVQFAATSSGTGDFVVSSAIQGFQTPSADGAINGETYSYRAQNSSMSEWEIGIGTWNSGTSTLARTTILASSTGSKVSFTIPPNVGLTPSKDDLSNASTLFVTGTVPLDRLPPLREVLAADRTYYVRTDGSDGNSGLANTSGGAFATIQKAINVALGTLDFYGYTVTIQIADGTYNAGGNIGPGVGITAASKFVIKGNSTTPGNVIVTVTASDTFAAESGGLVTIKDMELRTTTSGSCLSALTSGHIEFSNIRFGSAGEHHVLTRTLGKVIAVGNYAIAGGGQCHFRAISGTIRTSSRTITLSGTPSFSSAFSYAEYLGLIDSFGMTFSGSATGKRYDVSTNGVVRTNGAGSTYFPGNANGSTASGGQYV